MQVLGLQGSPRKRGSTEYLLEAFMQAIADRGADVNIMDIPRMNIRPCTGCGYCEKKGVCIIDDDDMAASVYTELRRAEIIVAASPVFFYSVTAQLKAMIDRTQALWSRKYRLKLTDPLASTRKGFLLSMGGSRGKKLFTGVQLVADYFFDAVQAASSGGLTYPAIETRDDFKVLPNLQADIAAAAANLTAMLLDRQRLLLLGNNDGFRTQMAAALIQNRAGDRFQVRTAGSEPAREIPPGVVSAVAELGLDLAFRQPQPVASVQAFKPHHIIAMNPGIQIPVDHRAHIWVWNLPDPQGDERSPMQDIREQIRQNVDGFLESLSSDDKSGA